MADLAHQFIGIGNDRERPACRAERDKARAKIERRPTDIPQASQR